MNHILAYLAAGLALANAAPESVVGPWTQLGATGGLVTVLVLILTRTIPSFIALLKAIDKRQHDDSEKLTEALSKLTMQCERRNKEQAQ